MIFDNWLFWPFGFAFAGLAILFGIVIVIFWIWMIVDCAKRNFRSNIEKIIWIVIIVFGRLLGALVYLLVIKLYNKNGLLSGKNVESKKKRK
ncbi:MAG: PLDc N-terminal domain-containing protein [Nanoarchaeota archaeon]